MPPKLNTGMITAAIQGFEAQKARLDTQIAELRATLFIGSLESTPTPEPSKRKRRKMSAAGRRAIREGRFGDRLRNPETPETPHRKIVVSVGLKQVNWRLR